MHKKMRKKNRFAMRESATGILVADIGKGEGYRRGIQEVQSIQTQPQRPYMSEMTSGEVPIRNETKSRLAVESGANKTKSTGKRNRSWWQDAKAGSKGNPRRLHAHGDGKMVGEVGAKATVG